MNTLAETCYRRFLIVTCLALLSFGTQVFARRPPARIQHGIVETLDQGARVLTLRPDDGSTTLTLTWDKRTRFFVHSRLTAETGLSKGAHVTLWYRSPIFGPRYVERIVVRDKAARIMKESTRAGKCSPEAMQ